MWRTEVDPFDVVAAASTITDKRSSRKGESVATTSSRLHIRIVADEDVVPVLASKALQPAFLAVRGLTLGTHCRPCVSEYASRFRSLRVERESSNTHDIESWPRLGTGRRHTTC